MDEPIKPPESPATESPDVAFIISLPRSGSTMLQKTLAAHPAVCSVAEPWICLPLAAMCEPTMIVAEYWQRTCHTAIRDLISELSGGKTKYNEFIRRFIHDVYRDIAQQQGATIFVDKTPRYYLIIPFLAEVFPRAKFILLFRNPLEVLASVIRTWGHGRIGPELRRRYVDISQGPCFMAEGAKLLGSRALSVNYSHLVSDPETTLRGVCSYLNIEFSESMLTDFDRVKFNGRMGDEPGSGSYNSISTEPQSAWKTELNNLYRKYYCRRYIRSLGPETLAAFDIPEQQLTTELRETPTTWKGTVADALGHAILTVWRLVNHYSTGVRLFQRTRRRPYLPYG